MVPYVISGILLLCRPRFDIRDSATKELPIKSHETICSLCGKPILKNPSNPNEAGSDEHTPALQFYPKEIRRDLRERLWKVPSHQKCNASYQKDEEYFYVHLYPLVGTQNEEMGKVVLTDIKRRMKKPQTPVVVRQMLKQCKQVSPGGILLPDTIRWVDLDTERVNRVVLKIAQCLLQRPRKVHAQRKL